MIPTARLEDSVRGVVAADSNKLADPLGLLVTLIMMPFTPTRVTDMGSLIQATFAGSAPKIPTPGAQASFMDPSTSENVIQLIAPTGGWNWVCTAPPLAPETIYGVCITDSSLAKTYGSQLLPTPVVITNLGDAITIGDIRMGLPISSWNDDPVLE